MKKPATCLALFAVLSVPAPASADASYTCRMDRVCVNADPCMDFDAVSTYTLEGTTGPGDSGTGQWMKDDSAPAEVRYEVDHIGRLFIEYRASNGNSVSRLATRVAGGIGVDSTYIVATGLSATLYGQCWKD